MVLQLPSLSQLPSGSSSSVPESTLWKCGRVHTQSTLGYPKPMTQTRLLLARSASGPMPGNSLLRVELVRRSLGSSAPFIGLDFNGSPITRNREMSRTWGHSCITITVERIVEATAKRSLVLLAGAFQIARFTLHTSTQFTQEIDKSISRDQLVRAIKSQRYSN
jgi:hypothetical protein